MWVAAWRPSLRRCVEPTRRAFACLPPSDPTQPLPSGQPAFALRTSHFGLRRWAFAVRLGERENGSAGERETGAVEPEDVLPSWSWFLFGRALPPLEVRSRQPDLTRSREVRHAARRFFVGGGLASFFAPLRGTDPPCLRLPAAVRSNTALSISCTRTSHFALRTSAFGVGPSPFGLENGRTGAAGERETGAVEPEDVLPSWSWFLFGRGVPPLEVRSRQPDLTRSRQVRHAARRFFVGGGLASFFAPLRGTKPPCIRLPAAVRSNTALSIRAPRTSHFALRTSAFGVGPSPFGLENGRTGARENGKREPWNLRMCCPVGLGSFSVAVCPPWKCGLGSLISREAAKYATPQGDSLWAAAWRPSLRRCVEPARRAFACLPPSDPAKPFPFGQHARGFRLAAGIRFGHLAGLPHCTRPNRKFPHDLLSSSVNRRQERQ